MRVAVIAAALLAAAAPALAAPPIPLQAGTYCGPGDARIVVDVARDQVEIDRMVCSFPVIAGDHLQSDLCSKPDGTSVKLDVDFRVLGRSFSHAGAWYSPCGPVPPAPSAPNAAAPAAPDG